MQKMNLRPLSVLPTEGSSRQRFTVHGAIESDDAALVKFILESGGIPAPKLSEALEAAKSQKKMKNLVSDQGSLQKKLQKYQASLEDNKKEQQSQEALAGQQQHALDSLRTMRKH